MGTWKIRALHAILASTFRAMLGTFLAFSMLLLPPLDSDRGGSLITYGEDGQERWRAEWTLRRVQLEGRPAVHFTEDGQGLYSPFKQPVRWHLEAHWTHGERFSPLRSVKEFSDLEGQPLVRESFTFDWSRGEARYEHYDHTRGRATEKTLKVPENTLTAEGLATALRALPFDSPREVEAHLLTPEPKLYRVSFKIRGRETVQTPAGESPAFRVEMDVKLGFMSLLKALVPETVFWYSVEAPNSWLRYQGLESGRGSPKVTRVSTGQRVLSAEVEPEPTSVCCRASIQEHP